MSQCSRSIQTSSPTPVTTFQSSCSWLSSCSLRAKPTLMIPLLNRWSRRGSSALSPNAEIIVRLVEPTSVTYEGVQELAKITCMFSLCSCGTEHEDVGRDEGGDSVRSDLLHESQDGHELQQRLHERPHPVPLQERAPSSDRKHIQVLFFHECGGSAGLDILCLCKIRFNFKAFATSHLLVITSYQLLLYLACDVLFRPSQWSLLCSGLAPALRFYQSLLLVVFILLYKKFTSSWPPHPAITCRRWEMGNVLQCHRIMAETQLLQPLLPLFPWTAISETADYHSLYFLLPGNDLCNRSQVHLDTQRDRNSYHEWWFCFEGLSSDLVTRPPTSSL